VCDDDPRDDSRMNRQRCLLTLREGLSLAPKARMATLPVEGLRVGRALPVAAPRA